MRLELTRVGLLAELANHYTTRGAFDESFMLSVRFNDDYFTGFGENTYCYLFYQYKILKQVQNLKFCFFNGLQKGNQTNNNS